MSFFQRIDSRQQLRLITIFGGNGAFLIELAEIEQIVRVIADGIAA